MGKTDLVFGLDVRREPLLQLLVEGSDLLDRALLCRDPGDFVLEPPDIGARLQHAWVEKEDVVVARISRVTELGRAVRRRPPAAAKVDADEADVVGGELHATKRT